MKTRMLVVPLFLALLPASCGEASKDDAPDPQKAEGLTVVLSHWTRRQPYSIIQDQLARFTKQTGIPLHYVPAPLGKPSRLDRYLAGLEAHDATPDVFQADITEIGRLAPHMIDLGPYLAEEAKKQIGSVMAHHVIDGRLVAFPIYTDVGLLYFRADLLKKYAYGRGPRTWDELEAMAEKIQAGEHAAGHREFWGLAWPGQADDDLLCVALEVQASHGGGRIIEADRTISVNNPRAVRAVRRMKDWVGAISPPGVAAYGPVDARNLWLSGDAAFFLSWPYAYSLSQAADSPIRGEVEVSPVPDGGGGHFGTLGGWQLSVSRYSKRPREAADLIRFLIRPAEQAIRAIHLGGLPPAEDLYDDPAVVAANPHFPRMKAILVEGTVPRPAAVTGPSYTAVSQAYTAAVHSVLKGEKTPEEALASVETLLVRITGFGTGPPPQVPHGR